MVIKTVSVYCSCGGSLDAVETSDWAVVCMETMPPFLCVSDALNETWGTGVRADSRPGTHEGIAAVRADGQMG